MVKIYVRDNLNGMIHEYGTNPHDSLMVNGDGSLHYFNLQYRTGTEYQDDGYTFVFKNGLDPRESKLCKKYGEDAYLDIGGEGNHSRIIKIEKIKNPLEWLDRIIEETSPTRAEVVFSE